MDTLQINVARLKEFQREVFRLDPKIRLRSADQAVNFVNQHQIVAFWPLKDIPMPSLWTAAAGDRPVADEHDDPGHVTWGWKDAMLGQRKWYYARILCKRNFMVALDSLPYLYALSNNYGDPAEDHQIAYEEGKLSLPAKQLYEALLENGPLDTLTLKQICHLSSKAGDMEFNKAVDTLQMELKVLPVGIAPVGSWKYAFIYDLVPHHFPELIDLARPIVETQARDHLLLGYIRSVGAARKAHATKLFRWDRKALEHSLNRLEEDDRIKSKVFSTDGKDSDWICLPEFLL